MMKSEKLGELEEGRRYLIVRPDEAERALEVLNKHISTAFPDKNVDLQAFTISKKGRVLMALTSADPDFYLGINENKALWESQPAIANIMVTGSGSFYQRHKKKTLSVLGRAMDFAGMDDPFAHLYASPKGTVKEVFAAANKASDLYFDPKADGPEAHLA